MTESRPRPCLPPASVVPLPELGELLRQLESLNPEEAARYRPQLAALEGRCAEVQAQLVEDEAALAAVKPEATKSAYERWLPRASAANGSRYAWRGLAVSAGSLREELEFILFVARCFHAPTERCEACQGTGWPEARPPAWPAVERQRCAECAGAGRVLRR